ncbi:MAG TPA: SGNH/GDSL hydrolase family protein [Polyangiaceae bacterium]
MTGSTSASSSSAASVTSVTSATSGAGTTAGSASSTSGTTLGAGGSGPAGANSTGEGTSTGNAASSTSGGMASSTNGGTGSSTSSGQGGTGNVTTSSETSGAGGTGGSGGYRPCPTNGDPCIVLPFGDSITDGVGSSNQAGYRTRLFELAVEANQKITFVGSRSSGPNQVAGQNFPKNHEGHPGWTIDSGFVSFGEGISTLIPAPAFDTMPHIVLLMIGTNDVSADHGTESIADRLETLLDDIVTTAPDALVVVAIPTPISWNPAALQTYSQRIPEIVEARAAAGEHMLVADMSQLPANNLASDGLHPNDQGYATMAEIWYEVIGDLLPQ